jgi:hypothetical protein
MTRDDDRVSRKRALNDTETDTRNSPFDVPERRDTGLPDGVGRRSTLKAATAGVASTLGLTTLTGDAAAASRSLYSYDSAGSYGGCGGVRVALYKDPTAQDSAFGNVYDKAKNIFDQLYQDDRIDGWFVVAYTTDRYAKDTNKSGGFGAYDVADMLEEEGWTYDDIGMWICEGAYLWDDLEDTYYWKKPIGGGSAGWQTAFDPDSKSKIAPCWMSTKNDSDRVVAHGASMEMMHASIDGDLTRVKDEHDYTNEHHLGDAIYEYNDHYGQWGYFGSPIAAGEESWNNGDCSNDVSTKDGITFSLTGCTKRSVEYTKEDRC